MAVHFFSYLDTGLTVTGPDNTVGSLIDDVLDPILVNGYNSRTIASGNATRSGTTATFTFNNHGYSPLPGTIITVSGYTGNNTVFNVTGQALNVTANTWQMTVADSGNTTSDMAGTSIRASLGWSKTTGTTNQASYRPATGNQYYLAFDDNTTATVVRARAFETITTGGTAAGNGTNPTPSDAQLSGGLYLYKASSAARSQWWAVSNEKILYFWIAPTTVPNTQTNFLMFGDFTSYKSADAYNTIIAGDITSAATSAANVAGGLTSIALTATSGAYVLRTHAQTGSSITISKGSNSYFSQSSTVIGGSASMLFPANVEGALLLTPVWLAETTGGIRGHLPGLWNNCHARAALPLGSIFTGNTGTPFAGKTFIALTTSTAGLSVVEISDTWDT